jgi:WD40 repeat protein
MPDLNDHLRRMTAEQRDHTLLALPRYLAAAEQAGRLKRLLTTFDFLNAKLDVLGPQALIEDYDLLIAPGPALGGDPFQVLQGTLRLSAHFLAQDKTQLAGQLLGRLPLDASAEIQAVRAQAEGWRAGSWLRPLAPTFTMPGGALRRTMSGHGETINALAVTPDGRWILSAAGRSIDAGFSADNTVRVWDLATGTLRHILAGHSLRVNAVAVTPDSKVAVSASEDETLKVWDLERGVELRTLRGHRREVNAVAITPDGRLAVSAGGILGAAPNPRNNMLRVWDLERGEMLRTLRGHTEAVSAVAVLQDGRRALSGSSDGTLRVWDLQRGVQLQAFDLQDRSIRQLGVLGEGRYAVAACDGAIRVWDLQQGQACANLEFARSSLVAMAPLPDGRRIIAAAGAALEVWDLLNGTQLFTIPPGHGASVTALAVTGDGRYAISAGWDLSLKIWDLDLASTTHVHPGAAGPIEAIAVAPEGGRAVSASAGRLKVWDLASGRILSELATGHSGSIITMAMADAQHVVTAAKDHAVKMWDLEQGTEIGAVRSRRLDVWAAAVTPNGRWLVAGGGLERTLVVEDLWRQKRTHIFRDLDEPPDAVAVTADGRWAVSVGGGHRGLGNSDSGCRLMLWDAEHRKQKCAVDVRTEPVSAVAITADGRRALTGSWDGYLIWWDLESCAELSVLEGPGKEVQAVSLTADGKYAVSATADGTLSWWDLAHGSLMARFGGDAQFTTCAITPDGATILAGDVLGRLHILRGERIGNGT